MKNILSTILGHSPNGLHINSLQSGKGGMKLYRNLHILGFVIFAISFALPATDISFLDIGIVPGIFCAVQVRAGLLDSKTVGEFLLSAYLNLANIATIVVFIVQFWRSSMIWFVLQLCGLFSAAYWFIWDLFNHPSPHSAPLFVGYWIWLFSILFLTILMAIRMKKRNTPIVSELETGNVETKAA
jgi:hypothetical protein